MTEPHFEQLLTKETRALTPQMSGDLLAEIKQLAKVGYLQLLGTDADFEKLWRTAFFVSEAPEGEPRQTGSSLGETQAKGSGSSGE